MVLLFVYRSCKVYRYPLGWFYKLALSDFLRIVGCVRHNQASLTLLSLAQQFEIIFESKV